jgi:hypothetical protein
MREPVTDSIINPNSSCADLIRASTPLFKFAEGVDGRAKPGQDEAFGGFPRLFGRKNPLDSPALARE